jgi:hypothetical protein
MAKQTTMLLLAGATSFVLAALPVPAALAAAADILLTCKPSDGSDPFSMAIWSDRGLAQVESKSLNLKATLDQTQISVTDVDSNPKHMTEHWGTIDRITGHFVLNDRTQGQAAPHQIEGTCERFERKF